MDLWIKLYHKFTEWGWYKVTNTKSLFLHLLLVANKKDGIWQGIAIKRGQHITSLNKLAEKTGLSMMQVRVALRNLKTTHDITIESSSKYSLITINNYESYQSHNTQDNKLVTQSQQSDNTVVTTIREGRIKNINNKRKNIKKENLEKPEEINEAVWNDFVTHRKSKKAPLTETALVGIRKESEKAGWKLEDALKEICSRGWTGFKAKWVEEKNLTQKRYGGFI